MMLFFKKKQDKTINGIIRYLNLENFWFSCTEEEKQSLPPYPLNKEWTLKPYRIC